MVSSLSGDSMTIKERFSGGGGEIDWLFWSMPVCWSYLLCWEELEEAPEVSVNRALAAVRFIPMLVQGTAADCIIYTSEWLGDYALYSYKI